MKSSHMYFRIMPSIPNFSASYMLLSYWSILLIWMCSSLADLIKDTCNFILIRIMPSISQHPLLPLLNVSFSATWVSVCQLDNHCSVCLDKHLNHSTNDTGMLRHHTVLSMMISLSTLFVWACLAYKSYFFSQRTVFFSHTESINGSFNHRLLAKQA